MLVPASIRLGWLLCCPRQTTFLQGKELFQVACPAGNLRIRENMHTLYCGQVVIQTGHARNQSSLSCWQLHTRNLHRTLVPALLEQSCTTPTGLKYLSDPSPLAPAILHLNIVPVRSLYRWIPLYLGVVTIGWLCIAEPRDPETKY